MTTVESPPRRAPLSVVVPTGAPYLSVLLGDAQSPTLWSVWLTMADVAGPLCGLAVAGPLLPVLLVDSLAAVAGPVAPVLPDWVMPVVLAFPDLAPEVEFDVVFTAPDWPPLPESPEVATGLEVALPVSVEPVEPVFPEVAAALPQVPRRARHGATVTADPELPELPEFPELPDVAVPLDVAAPVFPELASPDEAVVSLLLVEVAAPEVPPVVVPVAVESPLWPDVAVAVEVSWAFPVFPELAVPVALPD